MTDGVLTCGCPACSALFGVAPDNTPRDVYVPDQGVSGIINVDALVGLAGNPGRMNADRPIGNVNETVITYSFFDFLPPGYQLANLREGATQDQAAATFQPLDEAWRAEVRRALAEISAFANVRFVEVAHDQGVMRFGRHDMGPGGYAYLPTTSQSFNLEVSARVGDVWFSTRVSNISPTLIRHEIGHGLGLKHPGPYGEGDRGPHLTEALDTRANTVMSYTWVSPEPTTWGLFDIQAIQFLYGPRDGATPLTLGRTKFLGPGGDLDLGTALMDVLNGRGGDDTLFGGAGADHLSGGDGADSLSGGDGADMVAGDAWHDTLLGGAGNDTLWGDAGEDLVDGGDGNDSVQGGDGNDTLYGMEANDALYGNQGNDIINGNMGRDVVFGGAGNDTLFGGRDDDWVYGDRGDDEINGNLGRDVVYGGDGADTVRGGADGDWLYGGAGRDLIYGDRGNDVLYGGAEADLFVYRLDDGFDWIFDFDPAEGDRVRLEGIAGYQLVSGTVNGLAGTIIRVGVDAEGFTTGVFIAGITPGQFDPAWII